MYQLTRLTVTAGLAVALVGLLVFASPRVFARLGINLGDLPELLMEVESIRAQGEALDIRIAVMLARTRAKEEVLDELIDGKLSLPQAAARVRDLCEADPEVWRILALTVQGNSDNERLCRQLTNMAAEMLRDTPERAAAVRARLERELDQILEPYGTQVP